MDVVISGDNNGYADCNFFSSSHINSNIWHTKTLLATGGVCVVSPWELLPACCMGMWAGLHAQKNHTFSKRGLFSLEKCAQSYYCRVTTVSPLPEIATAFFVAGGRLCVGQATTIYFQYISLPASKLFIIKGAAFSVCNVGGFSDSIIETM